MLWRQSFGQHDIAIDQVKPRNRRRHKKGHPRPKAAKQAAKRRTDHKAKPKARPQQAKVFGAVLWRGDIGDESIGDHPA